MCGWFGTRVRIDRELLDKARACAAIAGYSSAEELVAHAVEREIARFEQSPPEEQIRKRLKGLGYLP